MILSGDQSGCISSFPPTTLLFVHCFLWIPTVSPLHCLRKFTSLSALPVGCPLIRDVQVVLILLKLSDLWGRESHGTRTRKSRITWTSVEE